MDVGEEADLGLAAATLELLVRISARLVLASCIHPDILSISKQAMSAEARLQAASGEYQKLQADLSNAVEARQRLDAQLSETETVKKVCDISTLLQCVTQISMQVFAKLKDENTIFKLIGPVMVKQEHGEAKANVDKRLEFIQSEMCVLSS